MTVSIVTDDNGQKYALDEEMFELLQTLRVVTLPADLEALRGVLPDSELELIAANRGEQAIIPDVVPDVAYHEPWDVTPDTVQAPSHLRIPNRPLEVSEMSPKAAASVLQRQRPKRCNHTKQGRNSLKQVVCLDCGVVLIGKTGVDNRDAKIPNGVDPGTILAGVPHPDSYRGTAAAE